MTTNKDLIAQLLNEVWSLGDVRAVPRLIGDRYTIFHDPGDPWEGQTLDQAGYTERLLASRAPFPDQAFEIQETVAEHDRVAVNWKWTGTHRQPVAGFPATNRPVHMSGATIYSMSDGRVVGHWQIVDRLGVFRQLSGGA